MSNTEDEAGQGNESEIGLVEDPKESKDSGAFQREIGKTLDQTEEEMRNLSGQGAHGWSRANEIVAGFRPVPQFIWNISNFVFSKSEPVERVSEGLVFGLRRLLFASASDPVLGSGEKVNKVRTALDILHGDVIAGVSVIHAVCRRLSGHEHQRIWRPILDDALLRARIGYLVGQNNPYFGPGRGMLAGFAGRSGLAVLLATGDVEAATESLQYLAQGAEIRDVGFKVYHCDPLQVSGMILSAAGCGREAAFGTAAYASGEFGELKAESMTDLWLAAFLVVEKVRSGNTEDVPEMVWRILGLDDEDELEALKEDTKLATRRGHGWNWLIG